MPRTESAPDPSPDPSTTPSAEELRRILEPALGPVDIADLRPLTGGASRQTWTLDAVGSDGTRHPLILQRELGRSESIAGPDFATEDELLRAAARVGVPVAEIVADAAACATLGSARITRRVDGGETLGGRIVHRDDFAPLRRTLVPLLGSVLAAIHSIPLEGLEALPAADPLDTIEVGLDALDIRSPAFELALRHLRDNPPTDSPAVVLHGDLRVGNLLVDTDQLHLVLDWELAHVGHPVEDLGWLCVRAWRFGGDPVVGGIGPADQLLGAYAHAGGTPFTEADLRWGVILGTLRWGLICAHQASRHLDGSTRSVELATIGRRLVENEHDLLDLLDLLDVPHAPADASPVTAPADSLPADPPADSLPADPSPFASPTAAPPADSLPADPSPFASPTAGPPVVDHGRPTAAELVEAVREHLAERVAPLLDGADAYGLRVARNALSIVQRELEATPPAEPSLDEEALASAIRNGHRPDTAELASIRASVTARLAVANPTWAT